jgi:hypothetical protein
LGDVKTQHNPKLKKVERYLRIELRKAEEHGNFIII